MRVTIRDLLASSDFKCLQLGGCGPLGPTGAGAAPTKLLTGTVRTALVRLRFSLHPTSTTTISFSVSCSKRETNNCPNAVICRFDDGLLFFSFFLLLYSS